MSDRVTIPGVPVNRLLSFAIVCSVCVSATLPAQVIETYSASSGRTPSAPWVLANTALPAQPTVQNGQLVVETAMDAENMFYTQSRTDLTFPFPSTFVLEASVRYVSGSTSHQARAPITIQVNPLPLVGNTLNVGCNEIFILSADLQRGATAAVSTADRAHTYRIEIAAAAAGSAIRVYYDNGVTPVLAGATFQNPNFFGHENVSFGEGSSLATGCSEWEFVRHNAGSPCITAATEFSPMCPPGYHSLLGPVLSFSGTPVLGQSFGIVATNLFPSSPCVLLIGQGIPAFDLSWLGSITGSKLCVSPIAALACGGSSSATRTVTVPNVSTLCRANMDVQWLNADPTSPLPLPIGSSCAGRFTVGR
jgi:hypothetical protein